LKSTILVTLHSHERLPAPHTKANSQMKNHDQSIARAREYVAGVELPESPRLGISPSKEVFDYDAERQQALVVGSEVIAFVKGVTPEQRNDIVNASLLAQLVAKKTVPAPSSLVALEQWYRVFRRSFSDRFCNPGQRVRGVHERSDSFKAHEAIIEVAAVLLAGAPGALALVKTALESLQKMSSDSPWITLFNRESQSANTARFQVSLASEDESGGLLIALIAFGLEARTTLTQVLFFKFHSNDVKLRHHSGKVTINAQLLAAVRDQIAGKLLAYTSDYIRGYPTCDPSKRESI
jgi:hypothetical protein